MSYFDDITNTGLSYNPYLKMDTFDYLNCDDPIPPVGFELSLSRDDDMIVWKKALNTKIKYNNYKEPYYEPVIVKLKIPNDAAVVFTPTKCRASRAIVLGFYPCVYGGDEMSKLDIKSAMSWYDHSFKYNLGETVMPDGFNPDWRKTCCHGIHFFRNFDDAVQYVF